MIKEINLLTLKCMHSKNLAEKYLNQTIKKRELVTLTKFVEEILKYSDESKLFDSYYFGYSIPQISKEFDILRIDNDYILNIELKVEADKEKILKQLKQNYYYLVSSGRRVFLYAYIENENSVYQFVEDKLVSLSFENFVLELEKFNIAYPKNVSVSEMFRAKDYLVSVFNDTEKFLNGEYFLSNVQQQFKRDFYRGESLFNAIKGEAGTGKTLLLYDITKDYINEEKKILIIHCGQLNYGHEKLMSKGWNICEIKDYLSYLKDELDAVFIDEAQRLTRPQFRSIVDTAKEYNIKIFFSYDPEQYLKRSEKKNNIANEILQLENVLNRALTAKVRSNREIATFVKKMFDIKSNDPINYNMRNFVEVLYFDKIFQAEQYINYVTELTRGDITALSLTKDLITTRSYERYVSSYATYNSHQVIGQEFNHIILTLGNYVTYGEDGKLIANCESYYDVVKMLYQLATRAKEKLTIIIVNNYSLAQRIVSILNQ